MFKEIQFMCLGMLMTFALDCSSMLSAQVVTKIIEPKGAYGEVDTRLCIETMRILEKGTAEEKSKAIEDILAKPENFAPPVFYLLSNLLAQTEKWDEGAYWFYFGQVRARFDANRCADISARQAVHVLNHTYGPMINEYAFKDLAKLEALIPMIVELDRKTPHNYDHRWINLHGMDAVISGLSEKPPNLDQQPLSIPEDQWESTAETTRSDYLAGFQEAMKYLKSK